ncbi:MAG: dTMP kinase [Opitutales bacterium]|nr:dTMP kinase [Opitutales bacterium]
MGAKGALIVFEGGDGCGKTTQVQLLAERLTKHHQILLMREPGGTDVSEAIRAILLNPKLSIKPEAELLLFAASRAQLVRERIIPALEAGLFVICDRFVESTMVYQGIARYIDLQAVEAVNKLALGALVPTVTFLLNVPCQISRQRIVLRNGADLGLDRMEREDFSFDGTIQNGYLELAKKYPDRMVVVDGTPDPKVVSDTIWGHLKAKGLV